MKNVLKKYILQLTFVLIITSIIGYAFFKIVLPEYYFPFYPYIIIFYFLLGTVTITTIFNVSKKESKKYLNAFMILRTAKLMTIILFAVTYAIVAPRNTVISFLFAFFIFYLIYSIYETYVSTKLNRDNKNESSQE
jgi:hypothetical protein